MSYYTIETRVSKNGIIDLSQIPELNDKNVIVHIYGKDSDVNQNDIIDLAQLSDEDIDNIRLDYLMEKYK